MRSTRNVALVEQNVGNVGNSEHRVLQENLSIYAQVLNIYSLLLIHIINTDGKINCRGLNVYYER